MSARTAKIAKYTESVFANVAGDTLLMGSDEAECLHYAPAFLGTATTPLGEVAVYDADAVVQILERDFGADCATENALCDEEHDHWSDAQEYFDYNVVGGWLGPKTPIYLPSWCAEHEESSSDCACTIAELDHWGANRDLQALEGAGGTGRSTDLPVVGSDPHSPGYLNPYQFPIARLRLAGARSSILKAGTDPQRYWGIVAVPTDDGAFVFLQVYGQSNWEVIRPLLGWWGEQAIRDAERLATHLTRPAVRPDRAYRATRTPLFLDPGTSEGRRSIEMLIRAAQAGEGSVEMRLLPGTRPARGKKSA